MNKMNKTYKEYLTDVKSETLDEGESKKLIWRWQFTFKGSVKGKQEIVMNNKQQAYNEDGVYVEYRQSIDEPDEHSIISNDWVILDKNIDGLKTALENDDPACEFIFELTEFGKKEREAWYENYRS